MRRHGSLVPLIVAVGLIACDPSPRFPQPTISATPSPTPDVLARLRQDANGPCQGLSTNPSTGLPALVSCRIPFSILGATPRDPSGLAGAVVQRYPSWFGVDQADTGLALRQKHVDPPSIPGRLRTYKFDHYYRSVPVYDGGMTIGVSMKDEGVRTIINGLVPITGLSAHPELDQREAVDVVTEDSGAVAGEARLVVFPGMSWITKSGPAQPVLAWLIRVQPVDGLPRIVILDAVEGVVVAELPGFAT